MKNEVVLRGPILTHAMCPSCSITITMDFQHNVNICPECGKWYKIWLDLKRKKHVFIAATHEMNPEDLDCHPENKELAGKGF